MVASRAVLAFAVAASARGDQAHPFVGAFVAAKQDTARGDATGVDFRLAGIDAGWWQRPWLGAHASIAAGGLRDDRQDGSATEFLAGVRVRACRGLACAGARLDMGYERFTVSPRSEHVLHALIVEPGVAAGARLGAWHVDASVALRRRQRLDDEPARSGTSYALALAYEW